MYQKTLGTEVPGGCKSLRIPSSAGTVPVSPNKHFFSFSSYTYAALDKITGKTN